MQVFGSIKAVVLWVKIDEGNYKIAGLIHIKMTDFLHVLLTKFSVIVHKTPRGLILQSIPREVY